jgi:predicted lipoprotein with Yx(FWY)xxD motif
MRMILGATGVAAMALVLAACGSSSSSSSTSAAGSPSAAAGSSAPAAAGSSAPASAAAASGSALGTTSVNGTTVLTNAKGDVLYWFVPDTSTTSKCNGSCATFWPPVKAPATAGSGVTGTLGTITRADGSKQATYDGHPLYTFAGDKKAGEATGNGVNASGGVWWEMEVSGATPAAKAPAAPAAGTTAPKATATSTAKSGGYGY